tara:strand:- start:204 stop:860 length:657 start_codon:yes stop_codon:yes gene_type:complete
MQHSNLTQLHDIQLLIKRIKEIIIECCKKESDKEPIKEPLPEDWWKNIKRRGTFDPPRDQVPVPDAPGIGMQIQILNEVIRNMGLLFRNVQRTPGATTGTAPGTAPETTTNTGTVGMEQFSTSTDSLSGNISTLTERVENSLTPALEALTNTLTESKALKFARIEFGALDVNIGGTVNVNDPVFREQVAIEINKVEEQIRRVAQSLGAEHLLKGPPVV